MKGIRQSSVCVVVPTYNEIGNLEKLVEAVFQVYEENGITGKILIVDDSSPDGTGQLADEMATRNKNIHVIHRPRKLGLGSAYIEGFSMATEKLSSDLVFEIDADLSHDPKLIPKFIARLDEGFDVVVGSRRVEGGRVVGWSFYRKLVSGVGNRLARWLCSINVRDATSGYRAFKREALRAIDYLTLRSEGYAFQIETLFRSERVGLKVGEIPIVFVNRKAGKSKLGVKDWTRFSLTCVRLLLERISSLHRGKVGCTCNRFLEGEVTNVR